VATAVLAAGCGFRSPSAGPGDGQPPSPDTLDPDALPIDGGIDGPPAASCLPRWYDGSVTFGPPTQITELAAPAIDRDPYLSPDELTIYFSAERPSSMSGDIFTATRASLSAPFGPPQRSADISSSAYDSRFSMTSSELIAVVASDRSGGKGNSDIWIATRANKAAPFALFLQSTGLSNINGSDSERDPELSADGLRIYLSAGSPQRIVVSERSSLLGDFGIVQQIPQLFSGSGDADPSLSPDERIIVFTSLRGGGDSDLYYARRADKAASFGGPTRLPNGINSNSANDGDPVLSPDGCRLYFASDRSGNWEIYVAAMTPQ
jgi:Tol biopolymer transport system component